MDMTRRRFLEDSLLAAAALAPTSALASVAGTRSVRKSREPIRVGVIGVRGRGRAHIGEFQDSPDSVVIAICDPDDGILEPALDAVPNADYHRDLRHMLDRDDIDAVSIATPNHWHSLAAVWALRAGKHVYVEKPISHDIREGRVLYETAKQSNLMVQHGTQSRSQPATREALQWLREGGLGKVLLARGICYRVRESIGQVKGPKLPPKTCDYDLWTGPSPLVPLMRKNMHYDWHWDFATGNGEIGNQGVHQMDIARWGLGKTTFPNSVVACGGRLGYTDDGNTANTHIALLEYDDGTPIIFEVRGLESPGYRKTTVGVVFHCENGYLVSSAYDRLVAFDHDGNEIKVFQGAASHFQNFLDAIKSGNSSDLNASAWDGHVSSGMSHMANISYQLGQRRTFAAGESPFGESAQGNESFARYREHLASHGIDVSTNELVQGAALKFDPLSEWFTGENAQMANILVGKAPRRGFGFEDYG